MKQSVTVSAHCYEVVAMVATSDRYGCAIVMPFTEINRAVSQWLLTFYLYVSVTWPLTYAFHRTCEQTPGASFTNMV